MNANAVIDDVCLDSNLEPSVSGILDNSSCDTVSICNTSTSMSFSKGQVLANGNNLDSNLEPSVPGLLVNIYDNVNCNDVNSITDVSIVPTLGVDQVQECTRESNIEPCVYHQSDDDSH